jgi:hypothetical protein
MGTLEHHIFNRYPELKEFIYILKFEIQQAQRPADEIILDDNDVLKMLKISKRKLQYMKADGSIPFHTPPGGVRTYYLLSDILLWLKQSRTESIPNKLRIQ